MLMSNKESEVTIQETQDITSVGESSEVGLPEEVL